MDCALFTLVSGTGDNSPLTVSIDALSKNNADKIKKEQINKRRGECLSRAFTNKTLL